MLTQQFRYDNYRLHQLGNSSVFTLTLQAGLSAIKTPYPFCPQWGLVAVTSPHHHRPHKVRLRSSLCVAPKLTQPGAADRPAV